MRRNKSSVDIYLLGSVALLAISVAARPVLRVLALTDEDLIRAQCWMLVLIGIWCPWSWKRCQRPLLHPYTLIFAAAFAFSASLAALEVFGFGEHGVFASGFSLETISDTLALVAMCLISLHVGALLGYRVPAARLTRTDAKNYSVTKARSLAAGLFLLGAVPTAITLVETVSVVNSQGYFALYQGIAPTGIEAAPKILAMLFVPAALYLLALSERRRSWVVLCVGSLAVYCLVTLYRGGRSPAGVVLLSTAWLFDCYVRRIPRGLLFGAVAILLIVFSGVGALRNLTGEQRTASRMLATAFESRGESLVSSVAEMGSSMNVISHVLRLVPGVRGFDWGTSYLLSASAVLPNVTSGLHPAVASGTPSRWLIEVIDPATARAGGGIGFSFIAEAYLNFGWFGSPPVMIGLGVFWGWLCSWCEHDRDPLKMALLAGATAMSLALVRNDTTGAFRSLVWYGFLPYFGLRWLARTNAKRDDRR